MTFWQFLTNTKQDLQGLNEAFGQRFSALAARGHSTADLLAHYGDEFGHLPVERLQTLSRAHRSWLTRRRRETQLANARARAKLAPLPKRTLSLATTPDELDALVRAARICDAHEMAQHEGWEDILRAGLELWRACLRLTRKEGTVRCNAANKDHPEAGQFDDFIQTCQQLDGLAGHRWLAMRRGCRQGVLRLEISPPNEALLAQAELYHGRLAVGSAAGRTARSLLDELVLDDLEPWLLTILDGDAETQAIEAACQSLAGLLKAPPLQARRVGALYVGRKGAIAAVVADREGDLVAQRVLKSEGEWIARALELFQEHTINHLVLPAGVSSGDLLATAAEKLGQSGIQIQHVRPAALAEARLALTSPPHRLSPSVASALVLARRAIDPIKAWATIDPVSIGVAEYQSDLDPERLRSALKDTLELCKLQRRRTKPSPGPTNPISRGGASVARLNPLVRSVNDLRPGMTVHGVVTNVSHFGAFVSVGLPQEALIHISELSDEYVANPNEIVSIGQQVTAHILSADPTRGRISLSMKTQRGGMNSQPRGGGPQRRSISSPSGDRLQAPRSRREALASLERLFKK